MTEVVRLVTGPLIARQIARCLPDISVVTRLVLPARRMGRRARSKFEHDVLVISGNGPLGFHCCRSEGVMIQFNTLTERLT
jgi:hypothetical protein